MIKREINLRKRVRKNKSNAFSNKKSTWKSGRESVSTKCSTGSSVLRASGHENEANSLASSDQGAPGKIFWSGSKIENRVSDEQDKEGLCFLTPIRGVLGSNMQSRLLIDPPRSVQKSDDFGDFGPEIGKKGVIGSNKKTQKGKN